MKAAEANTTPREKNFLSKKYIFLSITLSLLSMALVVYFTYEPDTDFSVLQPKRWPGLFIALVVSFLRVWFAAARIYYLAEKRMSWLASFRVILSWDFVSSVTPSTIGGGPMATYAMTKEGLNLGQSSAIILFGVLLDQILFALTIPILLLLSLKYEVIPSNIGWVGEGAIMAIYFAMLIYAGVLAYAVLKNPAVLSKILKAIFRLPILSKYSQKIEGSAEELERYSAELRNRPLSFILKAFGLTFLTWLARIWLPTIVVLSMLPADVLLSFLRSLAMNFAFLAMPTPGGSGGVEGLFALFQGPLIDRKVFVGISLFVWRVISYYISIGFGMMATSWYVNKSVVKNLDVDDPQPGEPVPEVPAGKLKQP